MSAIEVDPFDASDSILARLAPNDPTRLTIEANLEVAVRGREFLDVCAAQTKLNVTIASALVAMRRQDESRMRESLDDLLEEVTKNSKLIARIYQRVLAGADSHFVGVETDDHVG